MAVNDATLMLISPQADDALAISKHLYKIAANLSKELAEMLTG
jgi:hypothetical protein